MKRLKLSIQQVGSVEVLTRNQLKKIVGGLAAPTPDCKSSCWGTDAGNRGTPGTCSQTGPVDGLPGACVCDVSGGHSSCYTSGTSLSTIL
jgi:hypothetical protein